MCTEFKSKPLLRIQIMPLINAQKNAYFVVCVTGRSQTLPTRHAADTAQLLLHSGSAPHSAIWHAMRNNLHWHEITQ